MLSGILQTKIRSSSLPTDVIVRPRLITRLNELSELPVVLITSPAGYGKSCLVSLWAQRLKCPCAWISLDQEDGGYDRFWSYFVSSLVFAGVAVDEFTEQAQGLLDGEAACFFVDRLMEKIRSTEEPLVLVLEDYHQLPAEAPVHQSVTYMVSHLPENLHVVITSRSFPKIGLQKCRVKGTLGVIEEKDLAFTVKEIEDFFFKRSQTLSSEEAKDILDYTKGWPVAVKLASLAEIDPRNIVSQTASAKAGKMINDYLFEEVIDHLPERIRTFLAITSCVDQFSVSLAARLLQEDSAEVKERITYLQENSLFISETEGADGKPWYRYHALFLEAVVERFSPHDSKVIEAVRNRAVDWYQSHGMLDAAVKTASLTENHDTIQGLIYANWEALYTSDRLTTLMRWFEALPESYVLRYPLLCAIEALPLAVSGRVELAVDRMKHAEQSLKAEQDAFYGTIMAIKGISYSVVGLRDEANDAAEEALVYLPGDSEYLRGMSYQILGGTKSIASPEKAVELFEKALAMPLTRSRVNLHCSALANLSVLSASLGDFQKGEKWAEEAMSLYEEPIHQYHPMLVYAYQAKTFILFKQNKGSACRKYLTYALTHAYECWNPVNVAQSYTVKALMEFAEGQTTAAETSVGEALALSPYGLSSTYPSLIALREWQDKGVLDRSMFADSTPALDSMIWIQEALSFVAGSEVDKDRLEQHLAALPDQRVLARLHYHLLLALVGDSRGGEDTALEHFEKAVELAEEITADEVFLSDAEYVSTLLGKVAKQGASPYAGDLYRSLPAHASAKKTGLSYKDLTEREREVIKLAASGLSTKEIGERLFISTTTAKKHLANVYTKLGVHSRTQAIARLQEQGVLSGPTVG